MGLDALITSSGTLTPEKLLEYRRRVGYKMDGRTHHDGSEVVHLEQRGGLVEAYTLERYYGPGYERGNWPQIYGRIMAMRAIFGNVDYRSDTAYPEEVSDLQEFTDMDAEDMWRHWMSPNWDDYFERKRQWNAANSGLRVDA